VKFDLTTGRWTVALSLSLALSVAAVCRAQEVVGTLPEAPTPQHPETNDQEAGQASLSEAGRDASPHGSSLDWMSALTTHLLLGSAITRDQELSPLTNDERLRIYLRQTYFHAGTYAKRLAGAGIDQARGVPEEWGGGLPGYEKRFASRFGQFAIQNTLKTAGDAALGYEPRYDQCRCEGFWPRTKHAIIRNFVTYNSTERELRPQVPLYGAAFVAGMTASTWKPGPRNMWAAGGYGVAQQAGWGILSNWLSEFSGDIGRKISRKH
jgi:hypothetical protein